MLLVGLLPAFIVADSGVPSCRWHAPSGVGRARTICQAGLSRGSMDPMSRAFVKESDGADGEELAELQVSPHRNLVTEDGLRQIEATIERLRAELAVARGADDRATVRRIQRDLRYWTERQRTAEPVRPRRRVARCASGPRSCLQRRRRRAYRIVGEDEADPARGRISYVSPIAHALIGKNAGEVVSLRDDGARIIDVE